jgi:hypothetical protein
LSTRINVQTKSALYRIITSFGAILLAKNKICVNGLLRVELPPQIDK